MFVFAEQRVAAEPNAFLWINVLIAAIVAAIGATVVDNIVKGDFNDRPHNSLLLANECLAEHQSAYVIYFIALLSGTQFSRFWPRRVLPEVLFLSFVIYLVAVAFTANHKKKIARHHVCPGSDCPITIPRALKWKIAGWNVIFTAFMLLVAVAFAVLATSGPES